MKKMAIVALLGTTLLVTGCEALIGGAVGAGGTAGGYEIHLNAQKNKVQKDYDAGKITKQEYDIRMDQIRRDSFVQ